MITIRKQSRLPIAIAVLLAVSLFFWFPFNHFRSEHVVETHPLDSDINIVKPHHDIDAPVHPHPAKPPVTSGSALPLGKIDTLAAIEQLLRPKTAPYGSWWEAMSTPDLAYKVVEHNREVLEELVECLSEGTCKPYQSKLVILDSPLFPIATRQPPTREDYFERSALSSFASLGVSYVFSQQNSTWAVLLHNILPNNVHSVLFQEGDHVFDMTKCFADDAATEDKLGCVQSSNNPEGIPAWKVFAWSDWPRESPLGPQWALVAEPAESGQTYVGFSIPPSCSNGFVSHSSRPNPPRSWIHANLEAYFFNNHNIWPPAYFERVEEETHMVPYAALEPEIARLVFFEHTHGIDSVPRNLVELDRSKMSEVDILAEVAKTRLLVGLKDPKGMALPYQALCLGVPFLNPVDNFDRSNPSNRSAWFVQNAIIKHLDPPYVYNVLHDDEDGFQAAIRGSIKNPIDSYIPEEMKPASVKKRWAAVLDKNWEAEARRVKAT